MTGAKRRIHHSANHLLTYKHIIHPSSSKKEIFTIDNNSSLFFAKFVLLPAYQDSAMDIIPTGPYKRKHLSQIPIIPQPL